MKDNNIFEYDHKPVIDSAIHIEARNDPHWEFPLHSHQSELELSLIIGGKVNIYCNREIKELSEGDLIIKNAGILHGEKSVPADPVEQLCLSLKGVHLAGFQPNHMAPEWDLPVLTLGNSYSLIKEMLLYLFRLHNSHGEMYLTESLINTLLTLVHSLIQSNLDPDRTRTDFPEVINNVIHYLDENYEHKISLEDLSAKFYISPYYLSRQFKKYTGYSINQYMINRRMGEAERMLLFDQKSIKETANQCGFSDLQYFYKTFKKYTGCTPIEFIEKYK